jgi:hypothetical protein
VRVYGVLGEFPRACLRFLALYPIASSILRSRGAFILVALLLPRVCPDYSLRGGRAFNLIVVEGVNLRGKVIRGLTLRRLALLATYLHNGHLFSLSK